jgi:hypothetical protein
MAKKFLYVYDNSIISSVLTSVYGQIIIFVLNSYFYPLIIGLLTCINLLFYAIQYF